MTKEALEAKMAATAPAPDYRQYDLLNSPEFTVLCDEKIALDAQKKAAEERLKEIGPEIEAMLMGADATAVGYRDGYIVKVGRGRGADRIIPTRLVELGVSIDIIAKATEEGKPYTFAQIVAPKAGK